MIKNKIYNRFTISLLFFFLSAFYGWLLRGVRIDILPNIGYSNFLQSHSHVAFLGWGFLAVISLIDFKYQSKNSTITFQKYSYWIMLASIVGMLISFPLQGYKFFSISSLSLFLLASYVYLWGTLKTLKSKKTVSTKFIRTGIYYYYLSSMAIWAIAFITVKIGKTDLYYNAIYFYLHFLYNGFFFFSLIGLFLGYIESKKIQTSTKMINSFFVLMNLACIPTYALSLLWNKMPLYVVVIGFIGASLQVIALLYFWKIAKDFWKLIQIEIKLIKILSLIVILSLFLKILMQFAGAFPKITMQATVYKPYLVIGYIHLFTLGFMSLIIFLIYILLTGKKIQQWGLYLFIAGVVLSEILLFSQGAYLLLQQKTIHNFEVIMWMVSTLMPMGLLLLLLKQFVPKKKA